MGKTQDQIKTVEWLNKPTISLGKSFILQTTWIHLKYKNKTLMTLSSFFFFPSYKDSPPKITIVDVKDTEFFFPWTLNCE